MFIRYRSWWDPVVADAPRPVRRLHASRPLTRAAGLALVPLAVLAVVAAEDTSWFYRVGFQSVAVLATVAVAGLATGEGRVGQLIRGPGRGLAGYGAAGGVMAGCSQGGGVGLALAEWMVHGEPGRDVFGRDVARYGEFASARGYLQDTTRQFYQRRFVMTYPNEQLPAGFNTPTYETDITGVGNGTGAGAALMVDGECYGTEQESLLADISGLVREILAVVAPATGEYACTITFFNTDNQNELPTGDLRVDPLDRVGEDLRARDRDVRHPVLAVGDAVLREEGGLRVTLRAHVHDRRDTHPQQLGPVPSIGRCPAQPALPLSLIPL